MPKCHFQKERKGKKERKGLVFILLRELTVISNLAEKRKRSKKKKLEKTRLAAIRLTVKMKEGVAFTPETFIY